MKVNPLHLTTGRIREPELDSGVGVSNPSSSSSWQSTGSDYMDDQILKGVGSGKSAYARMG
jgi:hypothetical protein